MSDEKPAVETGSIHTPKPRFATPAPVQRSKSYMALQNRMAQILGKAGQNGAGAGQHYEQELSYNARVIRQQRREIGNIALEYRTQKRLAENLKRENLKLQQQKIKLSLERSLMPRLLSRIRHVRRTVRTEGLSNALRHYLPLIARKFRNNKRVAGLVAKVPLEIKKSAYSMVERQLSNLSNAVKDDIKTAAQQDFVILCNSFPGPNQGYGGEFIRTRHTAYLAQGLSGTVIHLTRGSTENTAEPFEDTPFKVLRISEAFMGTITDILSKGDAKILCHSPTPSIQKDLQKQISNDRIVYWFHGFDSRDYRRLYFNYTTAEMASRKLQLDEVSQWRQEANQISFGNKDIAKIFVSDYLKDIAERDVGVPAQNAHVIPNYINGADFPAHEKRPEQLKKILLLRSFSQRNYGGDIAVEAIKIASQWEGFDDMEFTVRGFGRDFAEVTSDLWAYPNVTIQEQYSTPQEMAQLHKEHGILLCPTRFDTQGVTMCEAMASGMLCITNRTTGIPEFIDNTCGLLVPPENPRAMAKALFHAQSEADDMCKRAAAAAKRARAQCGEDQTVMREIALLRGTVA